MHFVYLFHLGIASFHFYGTGTSTQLKQPSKYVRGASSTPRWFTYWGELERPVRPWR